MVDADTLVKLSSTVITATDDDGHPMTIASWVKVPGEECVIYTLTAGPDFTLSFERSFTPEGYEALQVFVHAEGEEWTSKGGDTDE